MKIILNLITILFITTSCALKNYEKFSVNPKSITNATIKRGDYLPIELSRKQINQLVHKLNKSKQNGATKYMKKYWVQIQLDNDSIFSIACNNSIFSINSVYAYKTDNDFFDNYWNEIDGEEKSWKLYKPVEYKNQQLIQYGNQNFDSKQLENLKNVLDYYNIENKIFENKLYYKGEIDKELNWNYMTKSNDEEWLTEHINISS